MIASDANMPDDAVRELRHYLGYAMPIYERRLRCADIGSLPASARDMLR